MVYKTGRFGRFLACPGYPSCKNTLPLGKDGKPIEKKEEKAQLADFKCELCGGDMVLRNGRYGSFYACANYPTCKFTKQKVNELGVACPKCSAKIIQKMGKGKLFYSCERFPDCDFSTWDLPLAETCPDCGDMLLYKRNRKTVYCRNKQCEYKKENVEK
jgi:DNA topoisomerase-1